MVLAIKVKDIHQFAPINKPIIVNRDCSKVHAPQSSNSDLQFQLLDSKQALGKEHHIYQVALEYVCCYSPSNQQPCMARNAAPDERWLAHFT